MNERQNAGYELSEYDPEEVQFSRTPHPLAIATLVLGCFSFLAHFRTTFWLIPIVAVALGFASLYSMARNPERIGRKAALIGLVLALFFGCWAGSRFLTRQQWLTSQARQHANSWLQLLADNKLRAAHQMHIARDLRVPEDEDIEAYYKREPRAQEDFDELFASYPLIELVRLAPRAEWVFLSCASTVSKDYEDGFLLSYKALYDEAGEQKEIEFKLVLQRMYQPKYKEYIWKVLEVMPVDDGRF